VRFELHSEPNCVDPWRPTHPASRPAGQLPPGPALNHASQPRCCR
jgi:hypothetical protein